MFIGGVSSILVSIASLIKAVRLTQRVNGTPEKLAQTISAVITVVDVLRVTPAIGIEHLALLREAHQQLRAMPIVRGR